ncbi:hypothetical protein C8F04DRAFT_1249669 [Mycena alexandri]|uniref:F-box domain-containing protein n=1 Tax=Mycena alexandri TaxID=1745969 RepID=A0AAD6THA2_9AGAR|nr:hypothetical protein C8F04DRAFT_1249669 [Mycena alexandri]
MSHPGPTLLVPPKALVLATNVDTGTKLPAEALVEILWQLIHCGPYSNLASTQDAVMLVNRGWRRTVLANPRLWQYIFVDNILCSSIPRFLHAIALAKALPLHIHISIDGYLVVPNAISLRYHTVDEFLSAFLPVFVDAALPNCTRLEISWIRVYASQLFPTLLNCRAPRMVELHFTGFRQGLRYIVPPPPPVVFGDGLPSLQKLRFNMAFLACPLVTVTELRLERLQMPLLQLREALLAPRFLTHLILYKIVYTGWRLNLGLDNICTLPNLTHLCFWMANNDGDMVHLIRALDLPVIHTVKLDVHQNFWDDEPPAFLGRVRTAIVPLKADLQRILHAFPLVEDLDIRSPADVQVNAAAELITAARDLIQPVCKNLRRIILVAAEGQFPFPDDVLDHVFWWTIGPFEDNMVDHADDRTQCLLVDKHWNRLVTSNAALWCDIYVNNHAHGNTTLPLLSMALKNSKLRNLQICLELEDEFQLCPAGTFPANRSISAFLDIFLSIVSPSLHRLAKLIIRCPDGECLTQIMGHLTATSCTMLRHLEVEVFPPRHLGLEHDLLAVDFPAGLPNLNCLVTRWSFLPWGVNTVTELNLSRMDLHIRLPWEQLKAVLEAPHCLRVLHLTNFECIINDASKLSSHEFTCWIPTLTHLHTSLFHSSSIRVVAALRLPALQTLQVEGSNHLWSRLSPPDVTFLHTVTVAIMDVTLHLDNILCRLPALQTLDIRGSGHRVKLTTLTAQHRGPRTTPLCPALTHLVYGGFLSYDHISMLLLRRPIGMFHPDFTLTIPFEPVQPGAFLPHKFAAVNGHLAGKACSVPDLFNV